MMVHFTATVPDNNYFSIGFGPTMYNTDMILWQASGATSKVTDLWSTKHATPLTDNKNDLVSSFEVNADSKSVTFTTTRKLNTNDL